VSIPAFNEEGTISRQIAEIKDAMSGTDFSILVVDDGSTDRTASLARAAGAKVFSHRRNMGLASTFRTEMQQVLKLNADAIVHIDADLQYRADEIPSLLEKMKEGNDLVLGSRFLGTIEQMPFLKRLGNIAFAKVISQIVHRKITDPQTGFRAFNTDIARLAIISNHTYTQEQVVRAVRNNFAVVEIPAYFAKRNDESRLIAHPLEYAVRAGINLLRVYRDFAPLKFFGSIGAALFATGFVLGLYFTFLHFTSGIQGHTGLLLLMLLLLISGLQVILFGFLADMSTKSK